VIDMQQLRQLAANLITFLSRPDAWEDETASSFFAEQQEVLRKALDDSATPERYKVAVVGSFKVGKSSFVNALCDIKGLASVDSNPETAAIAEFRYADSPRAEVHFIRKNLWEG
jgi:GTP-binding protein EngB required for normal cell division